MEEKRCVDALSYLNDVMDGCASEEISRVFFAHLETCEKCRTKYEIQEKIREILKFIQEHYQEPLQIEALAARQGISSRFLRRYFTQEIGMSCLDYIQALRLNKAKELLWETSKSVTEIALETGYGTPQYFSRIFRQEIGMTPSEYRSSWKEKVSGS